MAKKGKAAKFITLDTGKRLDPVDVEIRRQADTGEGLIQLTPEEAMEMARRLAAVYEEYAAWARQNMTLTMAATVRRLRVVEGYSWRALARECHRAWNGPWEPPSNQAVGLALCAVAAQRFGEDSTKEPWNHEMRSFPELLQD